jgi:hypothetical protein
MGEGEEKEIKKKKSPWGRRISLGLGPPCWLHHGSQLLGELKADLRVSLNFFLHMMARSSQNYPRVASTSQGGFWSHGV